MNIVVNGNHYDGGEATSNKEVAALSSKDELNDLECITFGDFSDKDYDTYFSSGSVQNVSVQFICDTYNATKSWVEEGHKHTLLGFEPIDDIDAQTFFNADLALNSDIKDDESSPLPSEIESVVNGFDAKSPCDNENVIDCKHFEIDISNSDVGCISDTETEMKIQLKEGRRTETTKKPTSWASLFKSGENVENVPSQPEVTAPIKPETQSNNCGDNTLEANSLSRISMEDDERAIKLAKFINECNPDYRHHPLQLHGLINRANWCYINATLQSLLGIPIMYHFYKKLDKFSSKKSKTTSTPLTDSMIAFFSRFDFIEKQLMSRKENQEINITAAFEPKSVYDALTITKSSLSEKGRQEDAEEFLSFLLNGIHEELVALKKLVQPKSNTVEGRDKNGTMHEEDGGGEEDVWEQVGPKNKGRTIRKAVFEESLIKHVFGGVICSSVLQTGVKESTTFQPFFTLQLDIQSDDVRTLNDAIKFYFMKEKLQGFTCSKTKAEVDASRRISLEELPLMFIFHLKYFVFDLKGGIQKIHKEVDIPVDLEIPRDILSHSKNASYANMRYYKLHAVVYHHGKHAAGGHYTATVNHGSPFGWIHFDDNQIKTVTMNPLVKHHTGSVPYLLLYERIQNQ